MRIPNKFKMALYSRENFFTTNIKKLMNNVLTLFMKLGILINVVTKDGPLVKRLRHRPFTAVTRVRVPYGSPLLLRLIFH